jgi:hypothetical protein
MLSRAQYDEWVRQHRAQLFSVWAVVGAAVITWLVVWGPDYFYVRGVAPWPRRWMILFFLSVWCWIGLRFIALWIWAWVVLVMAPVSLLIPLRFYLDAWWLLPLLIGIGVISTLSLVVVVAMRLRGDVNL